MQSSGAALMAIIFAILSLGATPRDKRTILTSGDKVYTIHYQLGQSTVLYFGMKPETVICGNKNYFVVDKIKEGITIQPLGSFSTNLTVMSQGRRYLFYLTPAKNGLFDTFVDVRWVPEQESRPVAKIDTKSSEAVREIGGSMSVGSAEIHLKRSIQISTVNRSILEFEIKNSDKETIKSVELEMMVVKANAPLVHQVSVVEVDQIKPGMTTRARVIVNGENGNKGWSLIVSFHGKSGKIQVPGGSH
jgi:hypothetical protein